MHFDIGGMIYKEFTIINNKQIKTELINGKTWTSGEQRCCGSDRLALIKREGGNLFTVKLKFKSDYH